MTLRNLSSLFHLKGLFFEKHIWLGESARSSYGLATQSKPMFAQCSTGFFVWTFGKSTPEHAIFGADRYYDFEVEYNRSPGNLIWVLVRWASRSTGEGKCLAWRPWRPAGEALRPGTLDSCDVALCQVWAIQAREKRSPRRRGIIPPLKKHQLL